MILNTVAITLQLSNPFSLHFPHLSFLFPFKTLQLPPQTKQGTNLAPPHPSHACLPTPLSTRAQVSILPSRPNSFNSVTSSTPPIYLPLTKTLGTLTSSPNNSFNSFKNSPCNDTSLSSNTTRCSSKTSLTRLQSSYVRRTPCNDVV
ncbi:hypothetical protein CFOL_v3_32197 [Cephalotus follicularis]|uniref:Uncharacterized protein n=1 Tax=Cephalotus follicularis TaxID=3775 RepID=A0A1Q3D8D8_CEPFO|nr:hypothetical protein CFOL_v3_32197 [Cephalotus follicularis]